MTHSRGYMARYFDTGSGEPGQHVGHWLETNLQDGIRGFRCQFGYFRFNAIGSFATRIHAAAQAGYPVKIVLGSNDGSLLARDVQLALRVADGANAAIIVVAFANAEYHPKTIHIVKPDGSSVAI